MSQPSLRISEDIVMVLRFSGVPWRLEPGKRHVKLFVGERMVCVLPRGDGERTGYAARNALASVRRAVREYQRQKD